MTIDKRHATHPELVPHLDSAALRRHYLVTDLFRADQIALTHSHVERMVIGGVLPVSHTVTLDQVPELANGSFLERRELGIVNIGGKGSVSVDGQLVELLPREGLYVPAGTRSVVFASSDPATPARFYVVSTPAASRHELVHITLAKRMPMPMGASATSNERVIYQYVHPEICRSSQLLLGLTALAPDARVFHMMGQPEETRHIVVANEQAVISPPWSIHTGCGTSNYSFIWAMGGENQDYKDIAGVPMGILR
jgi:4-deoxy-L-threo-5-hexosulose-uronate ketol-isomerase